MAVRVTAILCFYSLLFSCFQTLSAYSLHMFMKKQLQSIKRPLLQKNPKTFLTTTFTWTNCKGSSILFLRHFKAKGHLILISTSVNAYLHIEWAKSDLITNGDWRLALVQCGINKDRFLKRVWMHWGYRGSEKCSQCWFTHKNAQNRTLQVQSKREWQPDLCVVGSDFFSSLFVKLFL